MTTRRLRPCTAPLHTVPDEAGFYTCEYCGCRTNAKLRRCCNRGQEDDLNNKWEPAVNPTPKDASGT